MKAVYTYLPIDPACGFNSIKDFIYFLSLSVEYSKKHFAEVVLVTTEEGKQTLIGKYKVGFTSVDTSLEEFKYNIPADLWAFAKLKSYALQTTPFCHLDTDVILWQPISPELLKAPMFFQNKEDFIKSPGYLHMRKELVGSTVGKYIYSTNTAGAYNCGIVGVNDLLAVKKWYQLAYDFVFNPENKIFWQKTHHRPSNNFLFEQYFIACICNDQKIKAEFLLENFDYTKETETSTSYTHLWGTSKQDSAIIDRIKLRLRKEFPAIYDHIASVKVPAKEVFKDIFSKGEVKYQKLLEKEIKKNKIKSICYVGYTNGSSKFIDANGKNIEFIYSDETSHCIPDCDLLIIKDVVNNWSKDRNKTFFESNVPAKFILATNFLING